MPKIPAYPIPLETTVIHTPFIPQLQFDILLQKSNLGPQHTQSHASLYMPSHGEFLVEKLVRHGLKSGVMMGLDEFALRGEILNQSPAEILIVCGADQHFDQHFLTAWEKIEKRYAYRVLITSEPIYTPLAFYVSQTQNARVKHERFMAAFQPHFVFYNSRIDRDIGRKQYGISCGIFSMSDPELLLSPPIPWEDKVNVIGFFGKGVAWKFSRALPEIWSRQAQIDWFLTQQKRIPFHLYDSPLSFRECYGAVNYLRFQLQARSGYFFHSARIVQSAITGTIPIILLHQKYLPLLLEEAPFIRPDDNILLGFDGDYDALLNKIADPEHMAHIHHHLPELMQFGTISSSVGELAQAILAHFKY